MAEDKLALIIPAAGFGKRLGERLPKPFLKIEGKTILEHTLVNFKGIDELSEVIISTSESFLVQSEQLLANLFPGLTTKVVLGGKERQDSIGNALEVVSKEIRFVAVHDAVRPFVNAKEIKKCLNKARETGGAILAVRAKDTLKVADSNNIIIDTPDRSVMWQAQTPQIFEVELFKKAYAIAEKKNFACTDDASLIENTGGKVALVEGVRKNFKITYPLDLELAELLLKNKST